MLRYFFASFILITCAVVALAGFRGQHSGLPPIEIFPDMKHQPKYQAQHSSNFFADGRAARKPVDGTIPLGYTLAGRYLQVGAKNGPLKPQGFSNLPDYYNTGKLGDSYGDGFPLEVSAQLIDRGEERFNINCAICHGRTGYGNGIVQKIGNWATVANLQDERIRVMPDGQIFSTITNGKNTMGAYGPQIAVEDRWAIVAYLRALQRSQNGKLADLTETQQKELQQEKK
ncbi:MAG: cccA [Chthoniobacteraceae bacterium]|nr:cccA [Chthoniobacteraceae bacterium]